MMTLYQENGLILVIHPQLELGVWLEKILADFGHSVTVTHDLTQGLAAFEQDRHHLMIVDLALMQEPRLIDFVKELKESRNSLKILNYINEGCQDFRTLLLIEVEELIAIVSKIIINKK